MSEWLRKLSDRSIAKVQEGILFIGMDFTTEASDLANRFGAEIIDKNHFGWTEVSFEEIRRLPAKGKKRPV